jgi:hypothetical protein
MTKTLRFRATCLLSLVLGLSAPIAHAEPAGPDIQGRWRPISGEELPRAFPEALKEPIEIASCSGGELCGRPVRRDGGCGPVILRLRQSTNGLVSGTLTQDGSRMFVFLTRQDRRLRIANYSPTSDPLLARSLPVVAFYDREGPPTCAPAVS